MGFTDSYKHLEKLCGEILNDNRRISAYIDEMIKIPNGSFYVRDWDYDLKQLKHYRWIRNQIAHELNCTEENMCEPEDTLWLDDFYDRIINQTDPLTLYSKAIKPRQVPKPVQTPATDTYSQQTFGHKKKSRKLLGCIAFIIGVLLIAAVIILISKIL